MSKHRRKNRLLKFLKSYFFKANGRDPNDAELADLFMDYYNNQSFYAPLLSEDRASRRKQVEPIKTKPIHSNVKKFDQNRHHNIAKSRGGQWLRKNIIWLKVPFHNGALHQEFDNSSLDEIIEILEHLDQYVETWFPGKDVKYVIQVYKRLVRMKANQSDGNLKAQKYYQRFHSQRPS